MSLEQPPDASGPSSRRPVRYVAVVLAVFLIFSAVVFARVRGWANRAYMDSHLGIASEITRLHLATVFEGELALMEKLAGSELMRQYLLDPGDEALFERAVEEIKTYQFQLKEGSVFWSSAKDRILHGLGPTRSKRLDPALPENGWFDQAMDTAKPYPYNADCVYQPETGRTTVFLNVQVRPYAASPGVKALGVVGSAIDVRPLANRITASFELINPNFRYYLYDSDFMIISSNDDKIANSRVSMLDYFPTVGADLVRLAALNDASDHLVRSGREVHLVRRIPDLNWSMVIHYTLPAVVTISSSVTEVFLWMLALGLLVVLAFCLYLFGPEKSSLLARLNARLNARAIPPGIQEGLQEAATVWDTPLPTLSPAPPGPEADSPEPAAAGGSASASGLDSKSSPGDKRAPIDNASGLAE